ncbi:MAG: zinc dependent phospholipase C family protein [Lachnospiraceae bacterium]|nr:zinc dependent phospholipase C family protein [Lachnospiraceae bacterium]
MRKKSHISLAMYLVRELKLEGLEKHKKAFCFGSILPDLTPKMLASPHEFETTYSDIQDFVRYIFTEGIDDEWKERVLWRRLGVVLHYMADYFTFPHNTSFEGNLKDHCLYESEMKYCLRAYVWTPEANRIFREAGRRAQGITSLEALFAYVESSHRRYMRAEHSVEDDCRQILSVCTTVFLVLVEMAYAENMVVETPGYRCA